MQNIQLEDILSSILDIIGMTVNKSTTIQRFTQLCYKKTFVTALELLSFEKQKDLITETLTKTPAEQVKILQKYFDQAAYQEILEKTTAETLQDYLKKIVPQLSNEQKKQIQDYFSSLNI